MSRVKHITIEEDNLLVIKTNQTVALYKATCDLYFTEDTEYYVPVEAHWAELIDVFSGDHCLQLVTEYNLDVNYDNSIPFLNISDDNPGVGRVWAVE